MLEKLASRNGDAILGCDANSRHVAWGNNNTNERGESLAYFISNKNLSLQNKGNTPTFIFPSSELCEGWNAIFDVTITKSKNLELVQHWRVSLENSFSDHRFILFELDFSKSSMRPFRNPRKTSWNLFKNMVKKKIMSTDHDHLTISEIEREITLINKIFEHVFKVSTIHRCIKR